MRLTTVVSSVNERSGRTIGVLSGLLAAALGVFVLTGGATPYFVLWLVPLTGICAVAVSAFGDTDWLYPLAGVSLLAGGWYFIGLPMPYGLLGWASVGYLVAAWIAGRGSRSRNAPQ